MKIKDLIEILQRYDPEDLVSFQWDDFGYSDPTKFQEYHIKQDCFGFYYKDGEERETLGGLDDIDSFGGSKYLLLVDTAGCIISNKKPEIVPPLKRE